MRISYLSLPRLILLHFCLFFIPIVMRPHTPTAKAG